MNERPELTTSSTRKVHVMPFGAAVLVASVLGILGPGLVCVLLRMTHSVVFYFFGMFLAFGISGKGIVLLYRNVDRSLFRAGRVGWLINIGGALVLAVGLYGSFWCFGKHVCMAGHMHHPPYGALDYYGDLCWVLFLGTGSGLLALFRCRAGIMAVAVVAFLVSYRFCFESFGGILPF